MSRVCRPRHRVVQRLQMLHVHRGHHIDARVQQLQHVLVALAVLRARHVRVRQLIHDAHLRMPRQDRVQVHLVQHHRAVGNRALRDDLQVADHRLGIRALVRLHKADHHIDALLAHQVRILEHLVGLAHARRRAKIDLQLRRLGRQRAVLQLRLSGGSIGGLLGIRHGTASARSLSPPRSRGAWSRVGASGSVKLKVVPCPTRLSTETCPCISSISRRTSASPSPVHPVPRCPPRRAPLPQMRAGPARTSQRCASAAPAQSRRLYPARKTAPASSAPPPAAQSCPSAGKAQRIR